MNRLSSLDAYFLYLDTSETPMHFGSLTIFGPATDSGEKLFANFRDHTVARFDLLASYRRRPRKMPLAIDHPIWADVDELDLDYHIRHSALPQPGTMEQLRSLVAELHAVQLNLERPLWQYYLIEGLEGGGFAVYAKVHHAAMDGVAGMGTLPFIYDLSPEPEPLESSKTGGSKPAPPSVSSLMGDAFSGFFRQGVRIVGSLPAAARTVAKIAQHPGRDLRYLLEVAKNTPKTIFNASITAERSFGASSVCLSAAKAIARARGATINDVVLAICAGALRRYLIELRALPDAPLTAAVPASLRETNDRRLNNQVLFTLCKLATDVEDPLQRLASIKASMQDAKGMFADVKEVLTTDVSVIGMPSVMTGLARLVEIISAANLFPAVANVIISNVPGPRSPIYLSGTPAVHYFPVSIPYHTCALNMTVQGYLDNLEFGLVACKVVVPDAQWLADAVVEEFEALRSASEALSRPDAIETLTIASPTPEIPDKAAPTEHKSLIGKTPAKAKVAKTGAETRVAVERTRLSPTRRATGRKSSRAPASKR